MYRNILGWELTTLDFRVRAIIETIRSDSLPLQKDIQKNEFKRKTAVNITAVFLLAPGKSLRSIIHLRKLPCRFLRILQLHLKEP